LISSSRLEDPKIYFCPCVLYEDSVMFWTESNIKTCVVWGEDLCQGRDAAISPIPIKAIKSLNSHGRIVTKISSNTASLPCWGRGRWWETWCSRNHHPRLRWERRKSLIPKSSILNQRVSCSARRRPAEKWWRGGCHWPRVLYIKITILENHQQTKSIKSEHNLHH